MPKHLWSAYLMSAIFGLFGSVYGQNTFDGYSPTVEADTGRSCPVMVNPTAGWCFTGSEPFHVM